jgi:hypothetical protein
LPRSIDRKPTHNPLERLKGEIKRCTGVVGIFANEEAITRLIGALLLEQDAEWAVQRGRYMSLETMAPIPSQAARRRYSLLSPAFAGDHEARHCCYTTPRDTIGRGSANSVSLMAE